MFVGVSPAEAAGIMSGCLTVVVFAAVVGVLCWRFPSCRSRSFWDKKMARAGRKLYGKCKNPRLPDEEKFLTRGPVAHKRSREEAPFVVPQILVDYGSRKTSYASTSDHMTLGGLALDLRRSSGSSMGSRRTSMASESDRRGSNSSLGSRRTSFASDIDRRGSASSFGSRRTSIFSDFSDRRESASSRGSRKSSDLSRMDDLDIILADLSDPENYAMEEGRYPGTRCPPRRISYAAARPQRELAAPYRRCHSLAELEAERREKLASQLEGRHPAGSLSTERRSTLSGILFSSLAALDQTGGAAMPSQVKKKRKRPAFGLVDTPVAMKEINQDSLAPHYVAPVKPTGTLKLQLLWAQDKTSLTVIIIEAQDLVVPGLPKDVEVNPYVKAFMIPGRTFKYRTKTLRSTRDPLFLEKFVVKDVPPSSERWDGALEFQVYSSHHVSRRHLVGVASVRFAEVDKLVSGQLELMITPQTVPKLHQGDLHISGCYQPVAGKIVFNVLEARNLPRLSLLGSTNPYIKVEMYVHGIREGKSKAKVRQNTQDPVWHHQVTFEVNRENPKLLGHVFVFHVLHKDMMTGVLKIGQVDLGWYSHGEQLAHWHEIMENPHRCTDTWHPITKPRTAHS